MTDKLVESVDLGAGVVAVILNRPRKRNAMSALLLGELADALRAASEDRTCRVIVLAARGPVFCAGADVSDPRLKWVGEPGSQEQLLVECQDIIASAAQPVVARVQGDVIGGGIGLVAAADLIVASWSADFVFTEARLGVAPTLAARTLVPRIGHAAALRMMLLGERVSAQAALGFTLVTHAVDPAGVDAAIADILESLLCASPAGLAACKRLANDVAAGAETDALYRLTSELIVSPDALEGGAAAAERRRPRWSATGPGAADLARLFADAEVGGMGG